MGPKVAPKKSKAELKAEAEAQAARLAELEQQRIELERLGAEQRFAEQQHLRTTMLQEIEDELRQQHDAEQAASLVRDSECLRHREMQNEVDEWEAHLNPSHLPAVHDEADLHRYVLELGVSKNADDPLAEGVQQSEDLLVVAGNLLVAGKLLTNPQRRKLSELTRLRLYEKMHNILNMAAQMSMMHQRFRDKYTKGAGNAMAEKETALIVT